jgi:pimeloyl-ACP methyl ester carboxylesterase
MQSRGVDGTSRERVSLSVPSPGSGDDRELSVSYRVAGEGDPVVLCHGVGLDAGDVSFRYALPALARDRRVYVPDLPGHGDSDKPRVRYTTGFFRRAFSAFVAELGLDAPAVAGISMGGAIALQHAIQRDVERLALVDSYGLGGDAPWRPPAWAALRTPFAYPNWWRLVGASRATVRSHLAGTCPAPVPDDLVADVYEAIQEAAVGRTVASWQRSEFRAGGFATDHSDRLADLDVPALLIHGTDDPLLPAGWSAAAAEALPRGEYVPFEETGHWVPRERPERFNRTLRRFLG